MDYGKFKFKECHVSILTEDPLEDLFIEYIKPEQFLVDEEQIQPVKHSINVLRAFIEQLEDTELIKFG